MICWTLHESVRQKHIDQRLAQVTSIAGRRGTLLRLRHFFGWALEAAYIAKEPITGVRAPGKPGRGRKVLARTEARAFLELLESWQASDKPRLRERARLWHARCPGASALGKCWRCGSATSTSPRTGP